jgi:hypothetical protein
MIPHHPLLIRSLIFISWILFIISLPPFLVYERAIYAITDRTTASSSIPALMGIIYTRMVLTILASWAMESDPKITTPSHEAVLPAAVAGAISSSAWEIPSSI